MDVLDPAGEYLRLTEQYRRMADEELLVLARINSDLTDAAQHALTAEMRYRGLKLEPETAPQQPAPGQFRQLEPETPAPQPSRERLQQPASDLTEGDSSEPDSYAEERTLIGLCTVWSARDALQVQWLLDRAGIPFYIGTEKATGVDQVTSDFSKGVAVQVMRIGWPWAYQALRQYEPADAPPDEPEPEWKEIPVRCPACKSTEVVFEQRVGEPSDHKSPFRWSCEQCGHRWEDDGKLKE